jgi:hypothetical protein
VHYIRPGKYTPSHHDPELRKAAFEAAEAKLEQVDQEQIESLERRLSSRFTGCGTGISREVLAKIGMLLNEGTANERGLHV